VNEDVPQASLQNEKNPWESFHVSTPGAFLSILFLTPDFNITKEIT
jgi:hypothetical protein